ncbi:MAG: methylated-DNA--[protein]-cysteine S-methyltransferase [Actinobacteria bacterium]|nr:methylated-DNA--[protein]-cysteine S-methyltransferase [Actinomycetota bacterium]
MPGATTFPTAIGRCGITWTDDGIRTIELPQASPGALRATLAADAPGPILTPDDAPGWVRAATGRIDALTRGADDTLADLVLDETGVSDFARTIYRTLRTVPPGDTITYGDLAHRAGYHGANMPRAIGQVMGRNPWGIVVPCHRVLAANGRIGGYSAHGGNVTKLRLLRAEARGDAAAAMPYDLDAARRHLRTVDPILAAVMDRVERATPRMRVASSTVAGLAEAIVGQQVSSAAAISIYARLSLLFPRPLDGPTASGIAKLSDAELRGAGLSGSKVAALRDLSRRALNGTVPDLDELDDMDDEAIVAALTPIRGIGRWTVEMLLIFRLGRPDILPVDDLAVRRGWEYATGRDRVSAAELRDHGTIWAPWRSLASWYLWRASELG